MTVQIKNDCYLIDIFVELKITGYITDTGMQPSKVPGMGQINKNLDDNIIKLMW
jgi:hypothetical protein